MYYGFHPSPFGTALVIATDRGLAGLAFADPGQEAAALADMQRRWPAAIYTENAGKPRRWRSASSTPSCGAPTGRCASC